MCVRAYVCVRSVCVGVCVCVWCVCVCVCVRVRAWGGGGYARVCMHACMFSCLTLFLCNHCNSCDDVLLKVSFLKLVDC